MKSELEPVQDILFLGLRLCLEKGRASLPVSKAREIISHVCRKSSQKILSYTEVSQFMGSLNWASGLIPWVSLHLRPLQGHFNSPCSSDPCHPTRAMAGPYVKNPYPFQAEFMIFTDAHTQGWGPHMRDSRIAGVWTHSEHELRISVLELKAVILALQHWVAVLQGHHVLIATDNTTVVAYINKQGETHSHLLLWLVVDLFLWLQTQDITLRARHIQMVSV